MTGKQRGPQQKAPWALSMTALLILAWTMSVPGFATAAAAGTTALAANDANDATAATDPAAATDPVVAQVLQMLRGGVAEPVIVRWLEKTGRRPAAVSSDDLVALHKAGASNDLQTRLIELAQGTATAPSSSGSDTPHQGAAGAAPNTTSDNRASAAPATAPSASSAPSALAPAPPAPPAPMAPLAPTSAAPAPPVAAPPASAPSAASGNPSAVKVRLAVTYRPIFLEDEVHWTLYLYVDGRFLVAVQPGMLPLPLPARTFDVELPPGKHLLRVTQERHVRYGEARGYISVSRVDPAEFPFDLQPGKAAEIDLRFGDTSIRHAGPVVMRVKEDGSEVVHLEPAGRDSQTWPALCEDVTANLPAGSKVPRAAQKELDHCLHWPDLWPGVAGLPPRAEVMAEIERRAHPASASR